MPRHRKPEHDLSAKSRKRKNRSPASGTSFEVYLAVIVLLFLSAGLGWFLWPSLNGDNDDKATVTKARELAEKHPDAEVFEMGTPEAPAEKKSP